MVPAFPSWLQSLPEDTDGNAGKAIQENLRNAIVNGDLSVGDRLPSETALASFFGVSRPVVREALHGLSALGLTETRIGAGTYVVEPPENITLRFGQYSARDLMEARPHIEGTAAAWAAVRCTAEQADEIVALCDRMDAEQDDSKWIQLDSEFHAAIAAASGNAIFAQIIASVREALEEQSLWLNTIGSRRESSNIEHRQVAEHIRQQNPEAAKRSMRAHLAKVQDAVGSASGLPIVF